ncbi:MAG TPA: alpha-amylase family glycosyl hydrolase [Ktedonobacterales bacterium]|nr:alpha-amylase family glycosyl hydrolase [Ktedonobacterales bacterium]
MAAGASDQQMPLWWQRGVIYQIYPRSFGDTNGDGVGDLPGITRHLDYLTETLGVDAIWISPFYPSPMADFGYDVSNYTDVDPIFGTLADFDELIAAAHARGLAVMIDWVPNHSSDQHPWFVESRASRQSPKRDWYFWADGKADGAPPNNWLSIFGGPAWTFDPTTGQWYRHTFLPQQPDMNWRNPDLRRAMLDTLRFWLDRGVDGFRIDAAHHILKDPLLRDNPPNPTDDFSLQKPIGAYDSQIHRYDGGDPEVHQLFREVRAILDAYSAERPRMAVGEIQVFDWSEWVKFYGAALDEFHLPFNFALVRHPFTGPEVRAVVDGLEAALPPGAWPNYVLGNHDEPRIATRFGPERARLAMLLLLTLRGTPTLYYGDELGMTDAAIAPHQARDPWGLRVPGLNLGRDPQRTPMHWTSAPNAGFAAPGVATWLPLAADYQRANVATELGDPRSMLALTRALLALRRAAPALTVGAYHPVDPTPAPVFAFRREAPSQRFLLALNFGPAEQTLDLAHLGSGTLRVCTTLDRAGAVDLGALTLRGFEGCVIELGGS